MDNKFVITKNLRLRGRTAIRFFPSESKIKLQMTLMNYVQKVTEPEMSLSV